jgi:hypothetical protein
MNRSRNISLYVKCESTVSIFTRGSTVLPYSLCILRERFGGQGRFSDHCGYPHRDADPLNPWNWPGRSDGIWLHVRCEASWHDSERASIIPDKPVSR